MATEIRTGNVQQDDRPGHSYQDWLAACRERLGNDRMRFARLETRWSWIRLIFFVAGLTAVILLRHDVLLAAAAGILGLLAFVIAVVRYTAWENRRSFAERASTVAAESFHASTRRDSPARAWQRPEDPAEELEGIPSIVDSGPEWSLTDQERDDLDLYGPPVGIFGLLNHTSTLLGARRLRDALDRPSLSPEHIRRRQEAVQWLQRHDEKRLEMMAMLALLRRHDKHVDTLVPLIHRTERPPRSILSVALRLWSAASILIFVYAVLRIAGGEVLWGRGLVALLVVNAVLLTIARPLFRRLRAAVSPWTTLTNTLNHFLAIARCAGRHLPDEAQLGLLRGHFSNISSNAHIPSLCEWLEWAGLHGGMRGVLNVVAFFDLHIDETVLARIAPNRDVLLNGLSAMAELDALCSLASFSAELPVACYPQPSEGRTLRVEDGRHPLILTPDSVPNSIHLGSDTRTWVITGPNAAGKSTFLRMVGVNVLLAQVGAAVPARGMTWSPVRLITDVRIRDDLARHESYFLSEVRRLRRLVMDTDPSAPMLGLIDEPFRGTNSQERAATGIALLEHLMASQNLFVIATHEEVLARTAAGVASAANYHFQEHLEDGGIAFDYLLRPGPAGTKTAIRILEREGYPTSLLERAKGLTAAEIRSTQPT
ncbi:MAG: hypothetical protein ABFE01_24975 [Phycisphaerales bacterium]